jgi:hypothetical protein
MSDNIVELVTNDKEDEKSYLKIEDTNGSSEIIPCDAFGNSESMLGFLVLWMNDQEDPSCFINLNTVRKITTLRESEIGEDQGSWSLSDD